MEMQTRGLVTFPILIKNDIVVSVVILFVAERLDLSAGSSGAVLLGGALSIRITHSRTTLEGRWMVLPQYNAWFLSYFPGCIFYNKCCGARFSETMYFDLTMVIALFHPCHTTQN